MRAIKVITKDKDCYKTHTINLEKLVSVVCTFPREEEVENSTLQQDVENAISEQVGQKIEFIFDEAAAIEFDLTDTPAKFIIYDDYGDEVEKTDDLEEVEEAIRQAMANVDINPDNSFPTSDFPPAVPEIGSDI
jgi:hypothetical protein